MTSHFKVYLFAFIVVYLSYYANAQNQWNTQDFYKKEHSIPKGGSLSSVFIYPIFTFLLFF